VPKRKEDHRRGSSVTLDVVTSRNRMDYLWLRKFSS